MDDASSKVESDRQLILDAKRRGRLATVGAYVKLSGPGWLQSAITLGGGSLASSLYLGVLAGVTLLWLQPLAMALGIVMLSAIGYVALSTNERPFRAINRHVNPVLGWSWALASLLANMVWALPQYALATGVLEQNLFPEALGGGDSRVFIVAGILVLSTAITWSYDSGGWGVRLYELFLKIMVGVIVVCFVGVVIKLAAEESLPWGDISRGFIPDFGAVFRPAAAFEPLLSGITSPESNSYWRELIVGRQRDVLISAAATAVGINMTFLFPYTLLKRGWGKEFRGLAAFDLGTGMLVPFVLATSCVVIASTTQFHARPHPGLLGEVGEDGTPVVADAGMVSKFEGLLAGRVNAGRDAPLEEAELREAIEGLPQAEKALAATLVTRDARDLAQSLRPLTGDLFADILFGAGVLGMALSTITLLMLISGFVICEIFDLPQGGWYHRLGCLAAATGVLGPFLWTEAKFWVAVPTSVFGFMLLPLAYLTFFFLMNQKRLLGDEMPTGGRRLAWNAAMAVAAGLATIGSVYMVWTKGGWGGLGAVAALLAAVAVTHFSRRIGGDVLASRS